MVSHFGIWLFMLDKSNSHYVYQTVLKKAQWPAPNYLKLMKVCVNTLQVEYFSFQQMQVVQSGLTQSNGI